MMKRSLRIYRSRQTFPILRLPILAIEHILAQVNDCDLFDLSLCSKRCARIVGSLPRMPTRMEITIRAYRKTIRLYRDGEETWNPFQWKFQPVGTTRKEKLNREISGVKMFCVKDNAKFKFPLKPICRVFEVGYKKQTIGRDLEMGAVITHLLRMFKRCKLTNVHVDFKGLQPEFRVGRVFSGEFPIENLKFSGESENSSLDSLEVLRKCQIIGTFYSETRNMHKESMLYLDIPVVDMWYSIYDSEDIMNFLKKWKSSKDMKRINSIYIRSMEPIAPLDYEELGAKPWDPKKRDMVYRGSKHTICCPHGMDIERDDGLLATFLTFHHAVWFVVWHKRFRGEGHN
ncbi:unnamed protein product [Caenorhabditis brenneri]